MAITDNVMNHQQENTLALIQLKQRGAQQRALCQNERHPGFLLQLMAQRFVPVGIFAVNEAGSLLVEHIILAVLPVVIAFVIGLPLGYLVSKTKRAANVILAFLGVIYSIPSLALFVMMPLILGTKILNPINIVVALAIASYKGWLVAMNFMHLNESQKLSRIVAFGTFIWLFILIGGLLGDYLTRVPNV